MRHGGLKEPSNPGSMYLAGKAARPRELKSARIGLDRNKFHVALCILGNQISYRSKYGAAVIIHCDVVEPALIDYSLRACLC